MSPSEKNIKSGKKISEVKILFGISITIMILLSFEYSDAGKNLPFSPGEKMVFQVKWEFITAGEASLEVGPMVTVDGYNAFHIIFKARTSEFVDVFYKVRDTIESFVDEDMNNSLLYRKQHKGKSQKEVVVNFNWQAQEATYSNFGQALDPIPLLPGTFDPLSVFFAFRLFDLDANRKVIVPVTDGKKCVKGIARVIGREKIEITGTEYDAYLVEPDLENIGGVFKKSQGAKLQIWVTADEKHIPIRIKSKIAVGSFIADLVSYEN